MIWFATADSQSRLIRAHIMHRRLAERGIPVYIVTTSEYGIEFLDRLGTPAGLLEVDYHIAFDERQNLDLVGTARQILRYVSDPGNILRDFDWLESLTRHALCVVNDFHPALLIGGCLRGGDLPLVHVHGDYQWRAMGRPFERPVGAWLNPVYERLLRRIRHDGVAQIVERPLAGFEADWQASDRIDLPPLVPGLDEGPAVPASDDRPEGPRLAAYLNPRFRDPAVAGAVERAADRLDADLVGAAEQFTDRPDWQHWRPGFVGRAARADLLVAPPAIDAIGLSRTYGIPLLMVLPDQPEQQRNAHRYLAAADGPPRTAVELEGDADEPDLAERLSASAASLMAADNPAADRNRVDRVQHAWSRTIATIVERLRSRPHRARRPHRQLTDGSGAGSRMRSSK